MPTATTTLTTKACGYCGPGVNHTGQCPKVKAIEYHPDGTIRRVEFHPPNAWYPQPYVAPAPDPYPTFPPLKVWCTTASADAAPQPTTFRVYSVNA